MKSFFTSTVLVLGLALNTYGAEPPTKTSVPAATTDSTAAQAPSAAKPWPHEASDLQPDPHVIWGKLENGVRYAILRTPALPARASLRLYMDVGAMMESDQQRGIAHFLEHLAFCGTKHFPAGEMIESFQRLGMKFGADANAATTRDKTVYQLELPRANEELTGEGLKLFRDFLDGMLLDEKEIDRERGVILSEMRARDSAEYRAQLAMLGFLLPETLIAQRNPLGDPASVSALQRQQFVDFYETWYTPGRAVVVAVGDFDAHMVQRLIVQTFQDAKARRGEQPALKLGNLAQTGSASAGWFADRDSQTVSISMNAVTPAAEGPETFATNKQEIVRVMANLMLRVRLTKIAVTEGAAIQSGAADDDKLFSFAQINSVSATCQRQNWPAALAIVEQELRRAKEHGFADKEIDDIKNELTALFQSLAAQADTRQPSNLADQLVDSLGKNEVFTHPADNLALLERVLSDLKKEDCQKALQAAWASPRVNLWLQGNLTLEGNGNRQILEMYQASQQKPVAAPQAETAQGWAYTHFGPAGQITERHDVTDLGLVQAEFANHVRVNIKRTTLEKDKVRVQVRFGGGTLELPAEKAGLKFLANKAFIAGGLQAHSIMELQRLANEKMVNLNFFVGEDAFNFYGICPPASLDRQLQTFAAYLTAPGYRPEARKYFVDDLDATYAQIEHTPVGAVSDAGAYFLHSDDLRFRFPKRAAMDSLTLDDLKAWLAQPLAKGYLEVSIVGDIDPDLALQAVANTLGALPDRDQAKPAFTRQRQIQYPLATKEKEIEFSSQTPCALAFVCWPTPGIRDLHRDRRIGVLAEILNDRLRVKVRKELGATYTPEVDKYSSIAFPDYGFVAATMTVDPQRTGEIASLVVGIGADLARGAISDDEFARAMKPELASLDNLDNSYWIGSINDCQEHPESLQYIRDREADYRSIAKSEIETLARQLLAKESATILRVLPTTAAPATQPAELEPGAVR